jgi:hypothetical protein
MKKTILMLLCGLMVSLAATAQVEDRPPFGKGKIYLSSSLSGLNLSYSKWEDWNMNVSGKAGYLFEDNWMLTGNAEFDYHKVGSNAFQLGAGLRYYIQQNGLYLGAGANYVHQWHDYDDLMPSIQLGYAFFLNRTVTIEPELYYNQSMKNHSDYSGFGLRIGIGIYFE